MNLEQWSVGGRGMGTLLIFLLSAGEMYTTFTFLGASGSAYGEGGPSLVSYHTAAWQQSSPTGHFLLSGGMQRNTD